jgi:flagellar basal-body rod modification protein FlgD
MSVSTIAGAGSSGTTSAQSKANQQAFGEADFLSIMLTEITNQDPLNPSDTGKMVESMRQLQVLANTASEKFRADVTWAQDMVGSMVNVTQVAATEAEKKGYRDAGLDPDFGYGNKDIRIDGFRVIDKTVWIQTADGKNYPIDNIKQVLNNRFDTAALTDVSNRLLGKKVSYISDHTTGERKSGVVSSVGYDQNGRVTLSIDNRYVNYDDIVAISA